MTTATALKPATSVKTEVALVQILNNAQALHTLYFEDGEKNEVEMERRVRNFMYYLSSMMVESYPDDNGDLDPVLEGFDDLEKALHLNLLGGK